LVVGEKSLLRLVDRVPEVTVDLAARGRNDAVHADVFDQLSVMSGVENTRSGFGLPVAVDEAFAASPQSGLAWLCFVLPGRPAELHPEPPTDPDMNLSIHPARATLRRPAPSARTRSSSGFPIDSIPTWVTCSLHSTGITPLPRYYEAVHPWPVHR
jgi:hypothetical protein